MLINYLKIAFRSLLKQKGLSFINVFGLSIGLACFSLFLLYAVNEFSFDRFHEKADHIYRVYRWNNGTNGDDPSGDAYMPMPLGPAMHEEFPDIENYVRLREDWGDEFVRVGNKVGRKGIAFADPQIFEVFDFKMKYGNPHEALKEPSSVILTEETALELFGESNPIGRILEIKLEEDFVPLTVTAVAENLPANSSIRFNMLGSYEYLMNSTNTGKRYKDQWRRSAFLTYVKLREGSGLATDEERLLAFRESKYPDTEANLRERGFWKKEGPPITYKLQPIREMHTDTRISGESVDPKNIWTLLAIAAGVLLIACINFTTLAIGRSAGRAKEVGVRKVIGGKRGQLIRQFLAEAVVLAVFSAFIGFALMQFLLPFFNELAGRELVFSMQQYPEISWLLLGLTLLVGLLAGSYPALVLSNFRPVEVLKSKIKLGGSNLFTKSLVTVQFVLSIGLVASTLIILKQLDFMYSKNPGFDKENVVVVDASGTDSDVVYSRFRQALQHSPQIVGVAGSELSLGANSGWSRSGWDYKGERKSVYEYFVADDFLDVLDMEILAGRNFDPNRANDTINSVVVNEAFIKDFNWTIEMAVGQELSGYFDEEGRAEPTVIGVVKDFNYRSFSEEILPQMFHQYADYSPYQFFVRIQPGDPKTALKAMENAWAAIVPEFPIRYSFLDENLNRFYEEEKRFSSILSWAGGISIFLACLGLFGLAALAAVNRTKEIGIRKVLGASVVGITQMLSKGFLKLVGIAILIASPLAWYFMNGWLNEFAYRIEFPWWYFVVAGMVAVAVAFLTVGYQGVKAALVNPVKSLRSE